MNPIFFYPLQFEPIYQYRLWGGRRLANMLAAPLPGDGPIGKAWLLSDRDDHPSHTVDRYFPAMMSIIYGNELPEDAIRQVEQPGRLAALDPPLRKPAKAGKRLFWHLCRRAPQRRQRCRSLGSLKVDACAGRIWAECKQKA